MNLWSAPTFTPERKFDSTLTIPGSKSVTNRALILASLSKTTSTIIQPLIARNTELMIKGLQAIGVEIKNTQVDGQAALIVTGGAVRLTGSGLGCPTWPQCTPGSYTPVPHQAEGQLHAWIEFGNRLLTFLLFLTAVAALILSIRLTRNCLNKSRVRFLALYQVLGIFGQAILGGITVLTDLNPIPVAGHYLLSIALITGAIKLRLEIVGKQVQKSTPIIQTLLRLQILLTILVLIVGTVVTGSGPHAGDLKAKRFGFSPQVISWIHADLVIALTVTVFITYLLLKYESGVLLKRT